MRIQSIFIRLVIIILCGVSISCSKQVSELSQESGNRLVTIHLNDRRQTIQNFGASDAWCIQFVGGWPDEKRNKVADWLFSLEKDVNGKPKGIGLSLWRFNIGAGSASQDNISDEWRRTEGFLTNEFELDWSRQQNQRWFLSA